jgi:hypothetical protein
MNLLALLHILNHPLLSANLLLNLLPGLQQLGNILYKQILFLLNKVGKIGDISSNIIVEITLDVFFLLSLFD